MTATLAGVGPYSRELVETGAGYSSGSFDLPGDERQQLVQNFHCIHDKTNVSMSVNPKDLVCLTCPEKHAFIRIGSNPPPVCIALTDQSFPPSSLRTCPSPALRSSGWKTGSCLT